MNKYLNDSDSDFETFRSVDSENVENYEAVYKQRLRQADGKKQGKVKFTL